MDDGIGGDFRSLVGAESQGDSLATDYSISAGIQPGGLYRFRYRARNVNGWSGWSSLSYIRAASVPARPPRPLLLSVDATTIRVQLVRASHDGGSAILGYELYRNQGSGTVDFINVTTFAPYAQVMTHTMSVANDGMTTG